jgi:adenine phosphoribosyltransferase (EC 2.4.2.7)
MDKLNLVNSIDDLKGFVREIPDFPKKGINFKDINAPTCESQGFCIFHR